MVLWAGMTSVHLLELLEQVAKSGELKTTEVYCLRILEARDPQ